MDLLSIARREVRVAARKRSSYRVRMAASAIALLVSGFNLWFVTLLGSRPASGAQLFFTLSWVALIYACFVGPALTADCINEERNDGTLGLLFLTNLNGVSISLGKLVAHGLLALYSIISIVPVMAMPVLLGGADAESLAKTTLVLLVTLMLSLVVGMFASTICRKPWMAAAMSLVVLSVLVAGLPVAALVLRLSQWGTGFEIVNLLSPAYSLSMASPAATMLPGNQLWLSLAAQAFVSFVLFAWITFLLPRVWKEGKVGGKTRSLYSIWRALKYGSAEVRRKLRARLLGLNPILWLSARERFGPMGHALTLLALSLAILWAGKHLRLGPGVNPDDFLRGMVTWIVAMPLLYICFCFRLAVAASERFAVDRKAGALELILCTPIATRKIILGHWLGLIRRFWGGALLLLALHAFVLHYIIEAIRIEGKGSGLSPFGLREVIVMPVRHILGQSLIPNDLAPLYIACLAVFTAAILIVVLWIALGWLGMALSLTLKREILAPWVSLALLAVPPVPLFACAVAALDNKHLFATNLFFALLRVGASGFFIVLANALFWIFLARRWTYRKLRGTASIAGSGVPLKDGLLARAEKEGG